MTPKTRLSDLDFRINHTMLPVSDLDRSVDFYTGLLGMKLARRNVSEARKVAVGLVGYGDGVFGPFLELTQKLGDDRPSCVSPHGGSYRDRRERPARAVPDAGEGRGAFHSSARTDVAARKPGAEGVDRGSGRP